MFGSIIVTDVFFFRFLFFLFVLGVRFQLSSVVSTSHQNTKLVNVRLNFKNPTDVDRRLFSSGTTIDPTAAGEKKIHDAEECSTSR
jgi:hypothetical protein